MEESWLSVIEYAQCYGISVSTLRRRIKSEKIKYKMVNGKYYLYSSLDRPINIKNDLMKKQIYNLNRQLNYYRKEVNALKMLVDLYESRGVDKLMLEGY